MTLAMVEAVIKTVLSLVLVGLATLYAWGWSRLRAAGHAPPIWRLGLYALGLTTVGAALLSPLDDLAAARFAAHMGQHLLLTMMAAPLLLLGNPLPLVLWGLPPRARWTLAAPLRRRARLRAALSALTFLPVAGVLHVTTVWLWHVPWLYDAAVEHELVHAVEHVTFFATAILFWWPIILPAPRLRPRPHPGFQILYLLVATAQNTALGMLLAVPEPPLRETRGDAWHQRRRRPDARRRADVEQRAHVPAPDPADPLRPLARCWARARRRAGVGRAVFAEIARTRSDTPVTLHRHHSASASANRGVYR